MVKPAAEQVEEVAASTKDGWYAGHGLAPTAAALETARFIVTRITSDVNVAPTKTGGIVFERVYMGGVEIEPDGTISWW